jgi:hypothetical protein
LALVLQVGQEQQWNTLSYQTPQQKTLQQKPIAKPTHRYFKLKKKMVSLLYVLICFVFSVYRWF